ncbi:MAG: hypothetical protein HY335_01180 [Deinococcus sp.]|nr:hypothetical protein [Deinococcus sp.]
MRNISALASILALTALIAGASAQNFTEIFTSTTTLELPAVVDGNEVLIPVRPVAEAAGYLIATQGQLIAVRGPEFTILHLLKSGTGFSFTAGDGSGDRHFRLPRAPINLDTSHPFFLRYTARPATLQSLRTAPSLVLDITADEAFRLIDSRLYMPPQALAALIGGTVFVPRCRELPFLFWSSDPDLASGFAMAVPSNTFFTYSDPAGLSSVLSQSVAVCTPL